MRKPMTSVVDRALKRWGYVRARGGDRRTAPPDFDPVTRQLFERVRAYTLTSPERIAALRDSIHHIVATEVPGAIVECGVWRGGSMMAAALSLREVGCDDRDLYLYDTFEGPPTPTDTDVEKDPEHFAHGPPPGEPREMPALLQLLPQAEIERLLHGTGYPAEHVHFVPGMVEETIPSVVPDEIALLRLDTDRYTSTAHELEHLYPRMSEGGIVIIDDYASFAGAREAADEYFGREGITPFLHRIDAAARLLVVPPR